MTTEWSHLPNAAHIDRVLASLKAHPEVWGSADDQPRSRAGRAAWTAAWYAAYGAARDAVWNRAGSVSGAARDAILALVAWDYSAKFLDMTSKELKMWWALSEDPAALLLLPAVVAFELIEQLELA